MADEISPSIKLKTKVIWACFIIIVIWLILLITRLVINDWDIEWKSDIIFIISTAVMGIAAAAGTVILGLNPVIKYRMMSAIQNIPNRWNSLIDSGATKYFDTTQYKIKNGKWEPIGTEFIQCDSHGLPIVSNQTPLNSFNVGIYRKYYKMVFHVLDKLEQNTLQMCRNDKELRLIFQLEEKVKDFYDIFKEQTRLEVIGETCMIVKSWNRGSMLIHKSDYFNFMYDLIKNTGWESHLVELSNHSLSEASKASGLHWLLQYTFLDNPIDRNKIFNKHIYMPIFNEIRVMVMLYPHLASHVFVALIRFVEDRKNKLSYPYLDRIYSKYSMREAFASHIGPLLAQIDAYLKHEKSYQMEAFYTQLIGDSYSNAIIQFHAVMKNMKSNESIKGIQNIMEQINANMLSKDGPQNIINEFQSRILRCKDPIETQDVHIGHLYKYITDKELLKGIKDHNKRYYKTKLQRRRFRKERSDEMKEINLVLQKAIKQNNQQAILHNVSLLMNLKANIDMNQAKLIVERNEEIKKLLIKTKGMLSGMEQFEKIKIHGLSDEIKLKNAEEIEKLKMDIKELEEQKTDSDEATVVLGPLADRIRVALSEQNVMSKENQHIVNSFKISYNAHIRAETKLNHMNWMLKNKSLIPHQETSPQETSPQETSPQETSGPTEAAIPNQETSPQETSGPTEAAIPNQETSTQETFGPTESVIPLQETSTQETSTQETFGPTESVIPPQETSPQETSPQETFGPTESVIPPQETSTQETSTQDQPPQETGPTNPIEANSNTVQTNPSIQSQTSRSSIFKFLDKRKSLTTSQAQNQVSENAGIPGKEVPVELMVLNTNVPTNADNVPTKETENHTKVMTICVTLGSYQSIIDSLKDDDLLTDKQKCEDIIAHIKNVIENLNKNQSYDAEQDLQSINTNIEEVKKTLQTMRQQQVALVQEAEENVKRNQAKAIEEQKQALIIQHARELEAMKYEIETERTAIQQREHEYETKVQTMKEQNDQTQAMIKQLISDKESYQANAIAQIREYEEKEASIMASLQNLKNENIKLSKQHLEEQQTTERLNKQIQDNERKHAAQQIIYAGVKESLQNLKLEELNTENEVLKSQISKLQMNSTLHEDQRNQQLQIFQSALESNNLKITNADQEVNKLNEQLNATLASMDKLTTDNETLKGELSTTRSNYQSIKQRLQKSSESFNQQSQEYDRLRKHYEERIAQMTNNLQHQETKIKKLNDAKVAEDTRIREIEGKYIATNNQLIRQKNEHDQALSTIQKQLESANRALNLQRELIKVTHEYDSESTKSKVNLTQPQKSDRESYIEKLRIKINELTIELNQLVPQIPSKSNVDKTHDQPLSQESEIQMGIKPQRPSESKQRASHHHNHRKLQQQPETQSASNSNNASEHPQDATIQRDHGKKKHKKNPSTAERSASHADPSLVNKKLIRTASNNEQPYTLDVALSRSASNSEIQQDSNNASSSESAEATDKDQGIRFNPNMLMPLPSNAEQIAVVSKGSVDFTGTTPPSTSKRNRVTVRPLNW